MHVKASAFRALQHAHLTQWRVAGRLLGAAVAAMSPDLPCICSCNLLAPCPQSAPTTLERHRHQAPDTHALLLCGRLAQLTAQQATVEYLRPRQGQAAVQAKRTRRRGKAAAAAAAAAVLSAATREGVGEALLNTGNVSEHVVFGSAAAEKAWRDATPDVGCRCGRCQ